MICRQNQKGWRGLSLKRETGPICTGATYWFSGLGFGFGFGLGLGLLVACALSTLPRWYYFAHVHEACFIVVSAVYQRNSEEAKHEIYFQSVACHKPNGQNGWQAVWTIHMQLTTLTLAQIPIQIPAHSTNKLYRYRGLVFSFR